MSRIRRWIPVGVLLATGAWTASCPGRAGVVAVLPCPPADSVAPAGLSSASLPGEWRLTAIATGGDTATGALQLRAYGDAGRPGPATPGVRYPSHGRASLALDRVGAVAPGAIDADDPAAPGVLVIEQAPTITMRLGAEANRADQQRFDGAYMALVVTAADSMRIAGRWRSGGVSAGQTASGHFCAERVR